MLCHHFNAFAVAKLLELSNNDYNAIQIVNVNCTQNSDALGVAVITTTILHVLRLIGGSHSYITSTANISSQLTSV